MIIFGISIQPTRISALSKTFDMLENQRLILFNQGKELNWRYDIDHFG
jgi:hypothetical protein